MKVAVTGASGLLGSFTMSELASCGHTALAWSRRPEPGGLPVDFTRRDMIEGAIETQRPDAIIHTAAISVVAECDKDPALAHKVNVSAVGELARLAAHHGIRLVHISSNQVFDGSRGGWCENDEALPVNTYGESKLQGEHEVAGNCPGAVILRPCLIIGVPPSGGPCPVSGIINALNKGKTLKMFTDEIRSPIAAPDIARAAVILAEKMEIVGTLHCGGSEDLTRHEFTLRLAEAVGHDAELIDSATREEMGMGKGRPEDLSLDSSRLAKILGWSPRPLSVPLPRTLLADLAH